MNPTLTTLLDDIKSRAKGDIAICGETVQAIVTIKAEDALALVSALRVAREALEGISNSELYVVDMDNKDAMERNYWELSSALNGARSALTHIDELFEKEKTK